jgi:hypothetical protein
MSELRPVELTEDRVPVAGMAETIEELVELYGGAITESGENRRQFTLPLRRGVATAGGVLCTLTWAADDAREATVKLVCDRDIDAPKGQRIAILIAGVIGSVLFMLWPFFGYAREMGTLAWVGGLTALAVYLLTLRKTSGGVASDFLARLARRQRSAVLPAE